MTFPGVRKKVDFDYNDFLYVLSIGNHSKFRSNKISFLDFCYLGSFRRISDWTSVKSSNGFVVVFRGSV